MAPRIPSLVVLLALVVTVSSERASHARPVSEPPPAGWTEVKALPSWVSSPPRREGYLRLVDVTHSNLVKLVTGYFKDAVERDLEARIATRLRPVLGAAADAPAAAGARAHTAVEKAYHVRPPAPGDETPGAQLVTAWVLWEIPLESILEATPEAEREKVRAALAGPLPWDSVPWEKVSTEPAWASNPPQKTGKLRFATAEWSQPMDFAKANAGLRALWDVRWQIQAPLKPIVGNDLAFRAGLTGATWRVLLRHAIQSAPAERGSERVVARSLWEVPIDRILETLPEAKREAARQALESAKPTPR